MSEEGKSRELEQVILDVARNERNGLLIVLLGVFLVNAGLIFSAIGNSTVAYVGGFLFVALGVSSTFFGFYVSLHYGRQYNHLLKE